MTLAAGFSTHAGRTDWGQDGAHSGGSRMPSSADTATAGTAAATTRDPAETWRVAYAALEVALTLVDAPSGALFVRHAAELHLLALRGVDQEGLDRLDALWRADENHLAQGYPYGQDDPPVVILPFMDASGLVGLALFMWPSDRGPSAPAVLDSLARVLATLLRRVVSGGSIDDVACIDTVAEPRAVALLALLEQNEWNVSRVARRLGVTRMTVYNRMHRFGIPRKRVRSKRGRTAGARITC